MKRTKKSRNRTLICLLVTLCMALSIAPVSVYADEIDFLPQGVTYYPGGYKHAYHTQINVTANVSVKDSDGAVVETAQVSKSTGDYIKGHVKDEALQTALANLRTKIEAPYKTEGTVTSKDGNGQLILDHFEHTNFYTFTLTSGDVIDFGADLEAAKRYFNEHPDATGTFTKTMDVHEYHIYEYTYDLNVQKAGRQESAIAAAAIENAKFDYQPGDTPQATAKRAGADRDKYEIAYECWQQFEGNEPVAVWYSDNGAHGSLPTVTKFENGKKYVYSIMLKPKDGYSFSSKTVITVNGQKVSAPFVGGSMYIPAVKTITPTKQTAAITSVAVENVKLDYQPGSAPKATAKRAGANQDKYDILYESWEKREKDSDDTISTVAYWYSDEGGYLEGDSRFDSFEKGGRYRYSVRLKAKDGYTFDNNLTNEKNVTLNGASLPFGSWVTVMNDGEICTITYGTETRPGQVVEKIDFDALINFDAGDKPRFSTGVVNPIVDTDHQRWDADDGSGYGITSSDFWNNRYNGKLITKFEAGKSYTYGVYFKISDLGMEEGYRFDKNTKLYINGEKIALTPDQIDVDDNGETIWFNNVLTMKPTTVTAIDVVEINGATVSFKDGDKPVFTGDVPDNVYYVLRAAWWELNSTTGLISTEPEFGSGIYENKITTFEAGKTYHYGVYVVAYGDVGNIRYVFGPDTKLKINGEFVNYKRYEGDTSDGSDGTMWVITDLSMTPQSSASHSHSYGTAWKYDKTNHWHECSCGDKADKAAHSFKWIIDKEPTSDEKGSKHEQCTVCGYKKSAVDIPMTDKPTEPTQPTDPVIPSEPTQPTTPTQPTNPTNPNNPTQPTTPRPTETPAVRDTVSPKTGVKETMLLWICGLIISVGGLLGIKKYSPRKRG